MVKILEILELEVALEVVEEELILEEDLQDLMKGSTQPLVMKAVKDHHL